MRSTRTQILLSFVISLNINHNLLHIIPSLQRAKYLDITTDSLILTMKKKSYERYSSSSSEMSSEELEGEYDSLDDENDNIEDDILSDDEDVYRNIDITGK
jgi:hypothetical protein